MKQFIINQVIRHSKRSIFISVLLTLIIGSGIRYVTVDDDLMKLIPEHIPSRQLWAEIEEEFGSTDFTYIAMGQEGISALNSNTLMKLYDVSIKLERLPEIEEVISMATQKKIVSDDGFMLVDDLLPSRELNQEQIREIKEYLESNELIRKRSLSEKGDYINILVRPIAGVGLDKFASAIKSVTEPGLKGLEVHYGGMSYISGEVPILMMTDIALLMRAAIIIMIVLLFINLRSLPGLIMILLTITFSAAAMMGFLGWMYYLSGNSPHYIFSLL
ncbi:MAG: MMPL family transporter, partial [Candidatus Marinimicrobia bacterium]|nr:MMPL family transporter [Candidatus Neomarinimicrobiota bacterium]